MLAAYFDASRQKTPDELRREVTCVAGFLSPIRKWKLFQHRWQRLLYKERLEYFHMTDFENYQGPYKQWTKKRHQDFLRKALWIIKDDVNFGFASAVALDDFEQAKKVDTRLESMSAFTFCIIQCLHAIEQQENRFGYNGNIACTFESGDAMTTN